MAVTGSARRLLRSKRRTSVLFLPVGVAQRRRKIRTCDVGFPCLLAAKRHAHLVLHAVSSRPAQRELLSASLRYREVSRKRETPHT